MLSQLSSSKRFNQYGLQPLPQQNNGAFSAVTVPGTMPYPYAQQQPQSLFYPTAGQYIPAPGSMSLPPDMMQAYQQKMMAIMSDPQKKALFLQLVQAAEAGKIKPMQLAQQLDKLVAIGEPKPKSIAPAFIMASLFGVGIGQIVRSSLSQFEHATTTTSNLEKVLHTVDKIPGIASLNHFLQAQLDKRAANASHQPDYRLSRLLKLDGYYETEQLKREMVQRHLGVNGIYQAEMSAMEKALSGLIEPVKLETITNRIRGVSRHSELMQLIKPEAIYFVPASMRDYVRNYTNLKNGHTATLGDLDQLICKNEFIKKLDDSPLGKQVLEDSASLLGKLIRESKPQEFSSVYEKLILKDPGYTKTLQKIWGKTALPKNYANLRQSLDLKPYWDHIYDNLKGLLFDGNKPVTAAFSPKSTLGNIDQKIARYHLVKHLDQLTPWRVFMDQIKGFIKRFENFEKRHMPVIESIKAFSDQMKSKGIRPLGRLTGLLWFNFSRMFEGNHYQRWRLVSLLNKKSSGFLNRLLIAGTIFGFSVLLSQTGRNESRRSRFFDSIATGLGGFYGWELGRNILPQLEPVHNNYLAHVLNKRLIKWPFTLTTGGFVNFFMPFFITSWLFGMMAQRPMHWIFGDPDKIDKRLNKRDTEKMLEQLKAENIISSNGKVSITPPPFQVTSPQSSYYNNALYSQSYMMPPYWPSNYYSPYYMQTGWPTGMPMQYMPTPPAALAPLAKPSTVADNNKAKNKIEPVSITKASQKIPKVTYTLDVKGSMDRLARNPLEDDANREELRLLHKLESFQF